MAEGKSESTGDEVKLTWRQRYDEFMASNRSVVSGVEEVLKILQYWAPHSGPLEIPVEAASSIFKTMSSINKYTFLRVDYAKIAADPEKGGSPQLRFAPNSGLEHVSHSLSVAELLMGHIQLILEMLALRFLGDRKRWRVVLLIELVKAWIRLRQFLHRLVLGRQQRRNTQKSDTPSTNGTHRTPADRAQIFLHATTWMHVLALKVSRMQQDAKKQKGFKSTSGSTTCSHLQQHLLLKEMSGKEAPALSMKDVYRRHAPHGVSSLAAKSQNGDVHESEEDPAVAAQLVALFATTARAIHSGDATAQQQLFELLSICKHPIYVLLIMRYGQKSWLPWGLSLAAGTLAYSRFNMQVANTMPPSQDNKKRSKRKPDLWSEACKEEGSRRYQELAAYALRPPFVSSVTRPLCVGFANRISWIPLLGDISGQAVEMLDSLERYHFYTNMSS